MAQPVKAKARIGALPITSASGAQRSGPKAKPAMKSATPRLMTSADTPYSFAVTVAEAPKIEEANAIEKITARGAVERRSFVRLGQF